MRPQSCFILIGDREVPATVLQNVATILQLQQEISAIGAGQPKDHKILLCHGEIMFELGKLLDKPEWDNLFHFCETNHITIAGDPCGVLKQRDIITLFTYAMMSAQVFQKDVYVVASADNTQSDLSGISPNKLWEAMVQCLQQPSVPFIIDRKKKITVVRPNVLSQLPLPKVLLDGTFENFLSSTYYLTKLLPTRPIQVDL
jgi:hypothetical protein